MEPTASELKASERSTLSLEWESHNFDKEKELLLHAGPTKIISTQLSSAPAQSHSEKPSTEESIHLLQWHIDYLKMTLQLHQFQSQSEENTATLVIDSMPLIWVEGCESLAEYHLKCLEKEIDNDEISCAISMLRTVLYFRLSGCCGPK